MNQDKEERGAEQSRAEQADKYVHSVNGAVETCGPSARKTAGAMLSEGQEGERERHKNVTTVLC